MNSGRSVSDTLEEREKDFTGLTDMQSARVNIYYRVTNAKTIKIVHCLSFGVFRRSEFGRF